MEGLEMSAVGAKEVMFIYNGNEGTADVEFDAQGSYPVPPDGSILRRIGKQWKVTRTTFQSEAAEPRTNPVLKINLTDQF